MATPPSGHRLRRAGSGGRSKKSARRHSAAQIGPVLACRSMRSSAVISPGGPTHQSSYPVQCRLGVNVVILTVRRLLPAYPGKQTFSEPVAASHLCQKRKSRPLPLVSRHAPSRMSVVDERLKREGKDSPNTKYRSRSALLQERASKLVSGGGELTTRVEPAMIGCEA